MDDSLVIKDAITIASPFIKSLVDTFVTPKLEKFRDKFKSTSNVNLLPAESHFTEYFHRTYKKLMVLNTLVFNNSQRLLNDIYIPLTIECKNNRKERLKIKGFPEKLSNDYCNILITDTAGMGKSTLMKTIFIDCINKAFAIPIFIELRRLSKDKTLIDEIIEQLNSIDKNFDKALLYELIADGDFLFILDGYDEIALRDREVVTADIQDFISKASNNKYFITSRPEKALLSFGNFQEFFIHPLAKKEAYDLLRKYDKQGQISTLLIKKLEDEQYLENIKEFLINPLLVSLLFTAFEHKQSIPFKKHLFYRQVFDANFENHDLTKGDSFIRKKYSNLEIDDFHRVLRHIGFSCLKLQQIEFTKDEILKLITDSKFFCIGLDFKESDFLLDVLKTVPLFTQDGNYYKWSHKSLQEYFAAQFVFLDAKESQIRIIDRIYESEDLEKFINILDLYYDMDYKIFRYRIEFRLLEEYYNYFQIYYNSLSNYIKDDDIQFRTELTFLNLTCIFQVPEGEPVQIVDEKSSDTVISYSEDNNYDDRLLYLMHPSKDIVPFQYRFQKNMLLNIFMNKNSPIVHFIENGYIVNYNDDYLFSFDKYYKVVEIHEKLDDKINSSRNFKLINDLIIEYRAGDVIINHTEAIKRYEEIKKELANQITNECLLDGL